MTLIFLFLGVCMLALALAFILIPLLRNKGVKKADIRNGLNIQIHKESLRELENDLAEGVINEKEFNDAKLELESDLLNDLSGIEEENISTVIGAPLSTILSVSILLPVFVIITYLLLGDIDMVGVVTDKNISQTSQSEMHSIEEMVSNLEQRLQDQPEDGEGWRMLARSYIVMNRFQDAVQAYKNAHEYLGDDAQLLADYAEAIILANNNNLTEEALKFVNLSLKANPDEPKSLWIAGYISLGAGNAKNTLQYWERLLRVLPPGSDEAKRLSDNIEQVKQNIGMMSSNTAETVSEVPEKEIETDNSASTASIEVDVRLEPALLEKVEPDDTVFVFARASSGPRMPLAIIRKKVEDLPVKVTLDDSLAMSPAMSMSKFNEVVIGARVSKSGEAMPHSGDLVGTSKSLQLNEVTGIKIVINEVLP